jgi:amino acid transporter
MAVIVVKLAAGHGPAGAGLTASVFRLPPGIGLSTLALASTFGFLSFARFESAGSVGEEAHRPLRVVPRSMVLAIAIGAVFYVACVAVQSMAFGSPAAFAASAAPLGELAGRYVGRGMADLLDLAALVSAIGAGLGCASVSSRMLYALARDGRLDGRLAGVSVRTGAPAAGLAAVMLLDAALLIGFAIGGSAPMGTFFYLATIGTLCLLAM